MENSFLVSAQKAVKYWWVSLIIGILSLGIGIWCLVSPPTTLAALTILFVIAFIVGGILEIIFAISNRKSLDGWGFTLAAGIIAFAFGIVLWLMPNIATTTFLIYFVGLWIMFRSIWGIGISVELQRIKVKGWGWLLALSILGVLFSFAFIIVPAFGAGVIIALAALAFIFYGAFRVYLAFKFKSWGKNISDALEEIREFEEELLD